MPIGGSGCGAALGAGGVSVPAYILAVPRQRVDDPRLMRPYQEQVEATMTRYGGRYRTLFRHRLEVLEGDWRPSPGVIILEFPSFEQARAWYDSPEYAPLRALRHQHERFDIILVDSLTDDESLLGLGVLAPDERARVQELEADEAGAPHAAGTGRRHLEPAES
jgi:uncharacterized protein (DUF1330 family)